ncbi:BTAD domain-containing putative transcriptional regulator [Streptomyces hainanensis]|uniref:AfsR/SARP family transcriptional regulator n=1 Tax=Streptomyces hainanensis TaxID=402648 RepID=A0A4R4TLK1_9ACTN|nr:BTAD domain-containing putative transcriptional regulator [Streptomyces hainanensis]TDC78918.1 AfsR/SARP family transcriptional regulator [Streptomyces hainanensis]
MRFGVLGPLALWASDGTPVRLPEPKARTVLARLLVRPGRPVGVGRLVDSVWGAEPPLHPANALQGRISRLRRALDAAEPNGRRLLTSGPAGYTLDVAPRETDAGRFAELTAAARAAGGPRERAELLGEALRLWRGEAFAEFADAAFARAAVDRLAEEWLTAREELAEARLELGEHLALAAELAETVARHPTRERLRGLHLRALHLAGRQGEALAGYQELRRALATELGLDPGPELTALHEAILRGEPERTAARPAHRPAVRLPAPVGGLVGRDDDLAGVRQLLTGTGQGRLLTLVGPGGVGKSRLAVEVARGLADAFPDGVRLVELAGTEPADCDDEALCALTETVLAALGIRDAEGSEAAGVDTVGTPAPEAVNLGRLAAALRDRRLLLVLDNCEHLTADAAALAEALLRAVPGLRILATSREPLGIGGERLWRVEPLTPPPAEAADWPAAVAASSAARLFLERVAGAPGGPSPDAARAVAVICRRLDGLPLALELAASRARTLGLHGLVARLDDRFAVLTNGYRDAPPRQRTLRAVLDWSWEPLGEAERAVLRRLSVAVDGCAPEAAAAVCGGDGVEPDAVLDLLGRLVDRSLVVLDDRPEGPRYRLLESVREYGAERLRADGEEAATHRRHVRYHRELAERAAPALRGREQRRWLARLDAETGNLRRAIDLATAPGAAPGEALRLVNALAWYWVVSGRLGEARRALARAVAAAGPEDTAPAALATVWGHGVALLQGDAEAVPAADVDAALRALDGDAAARATARWFLAHARLGATAVADGERNAGQAAADFAALGDGWGEAAARSVLARHALARGDLAATGRHAEWADRVFRELGDDWSRSGVVFPLASLAEIAGDHARAAALHAEGLRVAEELGRGTAAVHRLTGLGRIALLTGDLAGAEAHHQRALALATEHGFRQGQVGAELGLALGARRAGELAAAEARLAGLLDWFRATDYGPALTLVLAELGFVAELRGDPATAHERHLAGLAEARRLGDPRAVALAFEGLAGALALAGEPGRAATALGAAAAARASVGTPLPAAERRDVDRATAAARAALGADAFAAAFAAGAAAGVGLTPEDAVADVADVTGVAAG